MKKTPEFIYDRVLRKFEKTIVSDAERNPSINKIGEFRKCSKDKIENVKGTIEFGKNEHPIILCWISDTSWCLLSTERVVAFKEGILQEVSAKDCEGPPRSGLLTVGFSFWLYA